MKHETLNQYAQRIERAVALLASRLATGEAPPTLDELAQAAAFSPFHFHRIYRVLTGETLAQTSARLRASRAMHLLMEPSRPITAIALSTGFATPQAFARAFRGLTGLSPSEARGVDAESLSAMLRAPVDDAGAASPLAVRVVSLEPFEVSTLRHVGDRAELFDVYTRLLGWAGEQGLLDGLRGLFGIPLDDPRDTPAAHCRFDAALGFDGPSPRADDITRQVIGGGHYLVAQLRGSYDGLEPLLDRLILQSLLDSQRVLDERPLFYEYLNDPEETPEADWLTDIYLPVC